MGFIDKLTKAFNLDNDDYYDEDDYELEDEYEEEPVRPSKVKRFTVHEKDEASDAKTEKPKSGNVLPYKKRKASKSAGVCVFKPTSVEDGREVVATLLEHKIVFLNLEGIDYELAQRVVDIAVGACYAIDGIMQKISTYIFVVAPPDVDVSGDFTEYLAESGIKLT